jgi:hypothetical protein
MKVLDPGHMYLLDSIDGTAVHDTLQFVKREGEGYPGNVGHYPGTILQDVLRACIDRVKYVDNQIHSDHNDLVLWYLRAALHKLESRAAERHGKKLTCSPENIEYLPVGSNGHLLEGAGQE